MSAGSIVACPTIVPAAWSPPDINYVGLENLAGLNLVNFLIHPHFEPEKKDILEREIVKVSYPVVALTNEQAILVHDHKIQIIGEGEKYFFNGFKEI